MGSDSGSEITLEKVSGGGGSHRATCYGTLSTVVGDITSVRIVVRTAEEGMKEPLEFTDVPNARRVNGTAIDAVVAVGRAASSTLA